MLPDRILNKIGFGDCWEWVGSVNPDGYGKVWHEGQMRYAHRVVWEKLIGPILEGLTIDHLCRNRACVNPAHMEPVTLCENLLRGYGVGAINRRKSRCLAGHPFSSENTQVRREKGRMRRVCAQCHRDRVREHYVRLRLAGPTGEG